MDGLHDVLRAGVPAVLPVGGPGAGGEEAAPAPIHTPAVAVGGAVAASRQALATLEGLWLAVPASADGFVWIGIHFSLFAGREQGAVEMLRLEVKHKSPM